VDAELRHEQTDSKHTASMLNLLFILGDTRMTDRITTPYLYINVVDILYSSSGSDNELWMG